MAAFISIEGGEGVGKSLFIHNLTAYLATQGVTCIKTREPGGTPAADLIRGLFGQPPENDPFCMMTEALLISAARAQHVEKVIRPALEQGTWVLCDRYTDSTRVYQGRLGGIGRETLETIIDISTGHLKPELTFLLDCDIKIAAARRDGRGDDNADAIRRYDDATIEFHEKLRQGYLALRAEFPERIKLIDASQTPEAVLAQAKAIILERGLLAAGRSS